MCCKYIRVAISGPHCVGKSTLINKLKVMERFKYFNFVDSFSNDIINKLRDERSDFKNMIDFFSQKEINVQFYILDNYIKLINKSMYCSEIHDRCIIDIYSYTVAYINNKTKNSKEDRSHLDIQLDDKVISYFKKKVDRYITKYDKILLLTTDGIELDRSKTNRPDKEIRDEVNEILLSLSEKYSNIVLLSPEDRNNIDKIVEIILS